LQNEYLIFEVNFLLSGLTALYNSDYNLEKRLTPIAGACVLSLLGSCQELGVAIFLASSLRDEVLYKVRNPIFHQSSQPYWHLVD
jgi:hypothetical protein